MVDHRAGEIDGGCQRRHGVDLERHRQRRRLEPGRQIAGSDQGLFAEPLDFRSFAGTRRRLSPRQRRPNHRAGGGYDLRVRVERAADDAPERLSAPRFEALGRPANCPLRRPSTAMARSSRKPARETINDRFTAPGADRQLGLVIDLDICVGCHACTVNCKEWNAGGHSAPMTDWNAYGGAANDDGLDDGAWGFGSTVSTPMKRGGRR